MTTTLSRSQLGERLLQWHGSMDDPVYAVGSFYIDGQVYPDQAIVRDALHNLKDDLCKFRRMDRGHMVVVQRYGKPVNLREFAGYTRKMLRENIADLRTIVRALEKFLNLDYTKEEVKQ